MNSATQKKRSMPNKLASILGILGVLIFFAATIIGGLQFENYSHSSQYISETYAQGTPWGFNLRFFAYVPSGILLFSYLILSNRLLPSSRSSRLGLLGIALFYGIGTILIGFFPCDIGCNRAWVNPSASQMIHNMLGLFCYLMVPSCMILIGFRAGNWPRGRFVLTMAQILGAIPRFSLIRFLSDPNGPSVEICQRILEGASLPWLAMLAVYMWRLPSPERLELTPIK